ncbi:MAG: ACT domain-containing protein [Clostridiales Family XIII bacterium]|jgi:hypothetical protein|nr:ACT domain-containing protein [Clostridiales Family XIII bacterium]
MELKQLDGDFAVCKLASTGHVDLGRDFVFLSRTDDEISLVCAAADIPEDATDIEKDWRGLKISGILDFSLIGIIAKISGILAERRISVFVVSTYNTDYIFLKSASYDAALAALRENGYSIV